MKVSLLFLDSTGKAIWKKKMEVRFFSNTNFYRFTEVQLTNNIVKYLHIFYYLQFHIFIMTFNEKRTLVCHTQIFVPYYCLRLIKCFKYKQLLLNFEVVPLNHSQSSVLLGSYFRTVNIILIVQVILFIYLFIYFWSFCLFQGHTRSIWRFPGQGWNWNCSHRPMPQPQQRQT